MSWQLTPPSQTRVSTDTDPVDLVLVPRAKDIGDFDVRRALPARERQMVGPFIFFDQMGPVVFADGAAMDVRPHPHIGISTITWLFEGEIQHQDSLGFDLTIRPGEVNWMTAGSGIVHSERSPQSQRNVNAALAGIQTWVALPENKQEIDPAFYHYSADQIPQFDDQGLRISLIAGSAFGQTSPVVTQSPTLYAEINLAGAKGFCIPNLAEERAIYVYTGELTIAGTDYGAGSMVVLKPDMPVDIWANADCKLMLLGGDVMDGPRHLYWNFVASSKERIEQAKADWRNDRFARVTEDDEFIPLPEDQ